MVEGGHKKKKSKGSKDSSEDKETIRKTKSIEEKGRTRLMAHIDPKAVDPFFNEIQKIVAKGFSTNMEVDNPDERPVLPQNTKITTTKNSYVIIKKLGAGGFGDVYEVHRERDNGVLAMKTEFDVEDDMLQRLKREVLVYEVINVAKREDPRSTEHILHMIDKGWNQYFKYIMMPYTGKSLDYIKECIVKGEFAPYTAIQISRQTHSALKNLHELGYIHRDVKPDNFVIGKSLYRNIIFVMDFGMSTKYEKTTANLPKESRYKFIGTPKYAARATHQGRVVNRKEDMESWFYMVIELFGTDYLPWSLEEDLDKMHFMKNCFFEHKYDDVVFHSTAVPKDLTKIMHLIDKVDGTSRPEYEKHEEVLAKLIKDYKMDYYAPFEWADAMAKYYFIREQKEEEKKAQMKRTKNVKSHGTTGKFKSAAAVKN
ncbi:unnamed protein product [Cylicocyclus nassatus]|uniref:non-specific serine/threonine protein kinase n=1 Tax=Cylicocyclus nassatus TaxID=53992 RepID=A0AA36DRP3_CYLNA|nr:unnamed protein product [Cylicocyclus nassatus]